MADCPNCGVLGYIGTCNACGHTEKKTLAFVRGDGAVVPVGRAQLKLTRAWAERSIGEEARFWAPEGQFTVMPNGADWVLRHTAGAPNETLVNGKAVSEVTLTDGVVVSIGREATGVSRSALTVKFL